MRKRYVIGGQVAAGVYFEAKNNVERRNNLQYWLSPYFLRSHET